ncbi:hypothetical protein MRB53_041300 [Persea americana]|nr:hypothetical protein MRB53_041300 [Persea americana]
MTSSAVRITVFYCMSTLYDKWDQFAEIGVLVTFVTQWNSCSGSCAQSKIILTNDGTSDRARDSASARGSESPSSLPSMLDALVARTQTGGQSLATPSHVKFHSGKHCRARCWPCPQSKAAARRQHTRQGCRRHMQLQHPAPAARQASLLIVSNPWCSSKGTLVSMIVITTRIERGMMKWWLQKSQIHPTYQRHGVDRQRLQPRGKPVAWWLWGEALLRGFKASRRPADFGHRREILTCSCVVMRRFIAGSLPRTKGTWSERHRETRRERRMTRRLHDMSWCPPTLPARHDEAMRVAWGGREERRRRGRDDETCGQLHGDDTRRMRRLHAAALSVERMAPDDVLAGAMRGEETSAVDCAHTVSSREHSRVVIVVGSQRPTSFRLGRDCARRSEKTPPTPYRVHPAAPPDGRKKACSLVSPRCRNVRGWCVVVAARQRNRRRLAWCPPRAGTWRRRAGRWPCPTYSAVLCDIIHPPLTGLITVTVTTHYRLHAGKQGRC